MLLVVKFRKQRKDNHSLVCIVDKVTSFFGLPQQFLITFSYNSEALSGSLAGKESACNAGDPGSILVSGRSSGEGIGYPLQYSWASLVAQLVKNPPAMWETWVRPLGWEDPLEKGTSNHKCGYKYLKIQDPSVQFSPVAQSCPTLCDPMNRSTPGLPVHHHLPEFIQTH